VRLLADVTGLINRQLLLQNEYLAAEKHGCTLANHESPITSKTLLFG
jgi:hypothetical protein